MTKNTKVVCTLGPASESVEIIEQMVLAGMNVVRLNFSHGKYENFEKLIKNVRIVSKKLGVPIAIMQDLQGPKIRVGEMPAEGIKLADGDLVTLTARSVKGDQKTIPVQYKELVDDVKKGDRILLCDGLLDLTVLSVKKPDINCRVTLGGTVKTYKGINVPTASISANPLTAKDKQDLVFGLKHDVDYVALSFVRSAENIEELRALIKKNKGNAKIVAKIERHEAIKDIDAIVKATDAVMVARGDLGVEMPMEMVPILQKQIIRVANAYGKPVITATEMLQSMVDNARPTRAEVSDVANAVYDRTDAIMLSNESAVGKYPVRAAATLANVAATIEADIQKNMPTNLLVVREINKPMSYGVCDTAVQLANEISADLIVAVTDSGFTARHIAKHRNYIPLVVITPSTKIQHQLQMVWGVKDIIVEAPDAKDPIASVIKLLKKYKKVKSKDKVVLVTNAATKENIITPLVI
jgi:pyruvate kinase